MNKSIIFKSIPYLVCLIIGVLIYLWSTCLSGNLKDLFINISAAFLVIPLLYIFYEITKSFSEKRLNTEILDYAKMQVDSNLLSITNQLQKTIFPMKEKTDSFTHGINVILSLKKEDVNKKLSSSEYLGFQIFKHWDINEKGLHELLKNPFILKRIGDEEIITLIKIIKNLRSLKSIQKSTSLYIETNKINKSYTIKNGEKTNKANSVLPDRHLLLRKIDKDKFVVSDFGDIHKYNLKKCLKYYKVNKKAIGIYTEVIYELIKEINSWIDKTGEEFILDTDLFKIK